MICDPNKFTLATKEVVSQLLQIDYPRFLFKISLMGDKGVGLSTFRDYYLKQESSPTTNYQTVPGCEIGSKQINVLGLNVKLHWWITSLKFPFFTPNYLRGSSLILLFYDITSKNSITQLEKIMDLIQKEPTVPLILVGNKCDLLKYREVSTEELLNVEYLKDIAVYIEISAETGENVPLLFELITGYLITKWDPRWSAKKLSDLPKHAEREPRKISIDEFKLI